ncbi:MAG: putative lipid II flippase FtsW [Lachnospiraceae bacterium]|nr:putative lipid II flippase FtsW [Lachnospiraceae bacterium]
MARKSKNKAPSKPHIQYFDYNLLAIVVLLLIFGMVMMYSASAYMSTVKFNNPVYWLRKQAFAAGLGMAALIVAIRLDYHIVRPLAFPFYCASLVLCIYVLFTESINGSSRWIYIGKVSVQPSELAKVAVIVLVAHLIAKIPRELRDTKQVIKCFLIVSPILGAVALANLSTAVIIAGIAFIMLFIASPDKKAFAGLMALGAVALFVFVTAFSYRSERISVWLHPEDYDKGFQTLQGLYAIGSGGLFGRGLGESIQKMGYVPEAQNDMIFSIICEELGIFGAVCILVLYLLLIWRLMIIAMNAKDLFGSYIAIGILSHIALQVILNIAVVTNTIPNTGVILPFISYGGTSMSILVAEMGLALSVSKGIELT